MTEEQFIELMKWLTRIEQRLADIEELITPPAGPCLDETGVVRSWCAGSSVPGEKSSYDEWCQRNVPGCEGEA